MLTPALTGKGAATYVHLMLTSYEVDRYKKKSVMLEHHRLALRSLGLTMNCRSYPNRQDSYVHFHELKPIKFKKNIGDIKG